jgi:hypothetical protein
MDNLATMILKDASASEIMDAIKADLTSRGMDKINDHSPVVASNLFNVDDESEYEE